MAIACCFSISCIESIKFCIGELQSKHGGKPTSNLSIFFDKERNFCSKESSLFAILELSCTSLSRSALRAWHSLSEWSKATLSLTSSSFAICTLALAALLSSSSLFSFSVEAVADSVRLLICGRRHQCENGMIMCIYLFFSYVFECDFFLQLPIVRNC